MEAGFVESRAGTAVAQLPSTSPGPRLGEWDGGNLDVLRPPETLGVRYRRNATGGKSSLTVAAPNIGDGSEAPNSFNDRLVNVRRNGPLLQCQCVGNGSGKARLEEPLYECFCGWFKAGARTTPPIKPSAQPFSPRPRSTFATHASRFSGATASALITATRNPC